MWRRFRRQTPAHETSTNLLCARRARTAVLEAQQPLTVLLNGIATPSIPRAPPHRQWRFALVAFSRRIRRQPGAREGIDEAGRPARRYVVPGIIDAHALCRARQPLRRVNLAGSASYERGHRAGQGVGEGCGAGEWILAGDGSKPLAAGNFPSTRRCPARFQTIRWCSTELTATHPRQREGDGAGWCNGCEHRSRGWTNHAARLRRAIGSLRR